jgi:Beta-lactamase enzyme family
VPAVVAPPPPPAIEQPAPYQVSYGIVTGTTSAGTRRVVVRAGARVLSDQPLAGRRFYVRVPLPPGETSVRVVTVDGRGRRSGATVPHVYGLPWAARPQLHAPILDVALQRRVRALANAYPGTSGIYVQNLTTGAGAAWNAKARIPAASTLKLAIAMAVLERHVGIPAPGSYVDSVLRKMIEVSDDDAANTLEVWLAGSTGAGGRRVDELLRTLGIRNSLMFGGYLVERSVSAAIPVRSEEQPGFGFGKYTTAADLAAMLRAVWLSSGGLGPLARRYRGFTAADGRHLLYLLAHVRDPGKLDREVRRRPGVQVLHKAGWIKAGRHDNGLVVWPGGIYVAAVMTYRPGGVGPREDALAGRVARIALDWFRG